MAPTAGRKSGSGKNAKPKLTREEKKAARVQRRTSRRETWRNLAQAFSMTRKADSRFLPLLIALAVVVAAVVFLVVYVITSSLLFSIPLAVVAAVLASMLFFSRRAQRSMYSQAEGQPGAAGWLLENQLRGDWRVKQAVAGTTHLDVVHRLVGRPGVVLVGEGAQHRVRGLIAQEKKKVSRLTGDTPIYDIIVGTEDGDVALGKLQKHLIKLPHNLSKEQVSALDKRLAALTSARAPLPQGPMPQGAKMRNVQRAARRRS